MTSSTSRRSSSSPTRTYPTAGGAVHVVASTRVHGDFHFERVAHGDLERRRRQLVDLPWTMLDERHGTDLVEVATPGFGDGEPGDVLATSLDDAVLGIWVGDCAPVVLVGADGRLVAAHAGWRGLAAGVLDRAVDALGRVTREVARAYLGPCIGPCCYEFGEPELCRVAAGVGADPGRLRATDGRGRPALDLRAGVVAALGRYGIDVDVDPRCTGCDDSLFSHRVRADPQRQVVSAWRTAA